MASPPVQAINDPAATATEATSQEQELHTDQLATNSINPRKLLTPFASESVGRNTNI
jgi:hypothetical protein